MKMILSKRSAQTIKSILLLAGSFTFAFLLGEFVHDSGHYLCHLAYGNFRVQVHFDPFGGTHISGANGFSDKILGVTSAAGPFSNLASSLVCFLLLWRIKRPILLPFLLWGPIAMIQEGVTFSLGLLTPGGDAELISRLGVPESIILIFGIILLTTGTAGIALLLPLAGIESDDSPRNKLLILLVSMCSLMLIRFTFSILTTPDATMENLIPLVFSLFLAAIIVLVHQPITRVASKIAFTNTTLVPWTASLLALALGVSMFVVQGFVLS